MCGICVTDQVPPPDALAFAGRMRHHQSFQPHGCSPASLAFLLVAAATSSFLPSSCWPLMSIPPKLTHCDLCNVICNLLRPPSSSAPKPCGVGCRRGPQASPFCAPVPSAVAPCSDLGLSHVTCYGQWGASKWDTAHCITGGVPSHSPLCYRQKVMPGTACGRMGDP